MQKDAEEGTAAYEEADTKRNLQYVLGDCGRCVFCGSLPMVFGSGRTLQRRLYGDLPAGKAVSHGNITYSHAVAHRCYGNYFLVYQCSPVFPGVQEHRKEISVQNHYCGLYSVLSAGNHSGSQRAASG